MTIFYVSPTGSNLASGTSATSPFATLAQAQAAMEATPGPNTTYIEAGTYYLSAPISLTAADSNDSFIAMPGAQPVISGGTTVSNWTVNSNGVWQAQVPSGNVTQFAVNGIAQTEAQYPNFDPSKPITSGWLWAQTLPANGNPLDQIAYNPADWPNGPPAAGEQVDVFSQYGYASNVLTIGSVNTQTRVITFTTDASYPLGVGSRYSVTGSTAFLNQTGTWSFNSSTKTLYYLPPAGFTGAGAVASGGNTSLFSINGASNVTIQGLTLTNVASTASASWGATPAIYLQNASGGTITGDTFTNDAEGVYLASGTHNNTIKNSTFSNIWAEAVDLSPMSTQNIVTNNSITNSGEVFRDTGAIQMVESSGNLITHNLIQNVPRFGIEEQSYDSTIPSGNNTIEYNEILNSGQQTPDTGAIYLFAGQDPSALGDTIAYNDIANTGGLGTTGTGFVPGQTMSWGIYLDNGVNNAQVYGNLVSGTEDGGVIIHGGNNNNIYNNVLVNNTEFGIEFLETTTPMTGDSVHNNVVEEPTDTGSEILSLNPAFVTPSLIYNNIYLSPTGFTPWIADNSFAGWQSEGGDAGSRVVTSAGFVNAAANNYAFIAGSPALADGIPQLPISSFGTIAPSLDTLILTLSEDAYNGDAQFTVLVNGIVIGGPTAVTASHATGATQTFVYTGAWGSGSQSVAIIFANDAYGGSSSADRNLYVNKVQYNGVNDLPGSVTMLTSGTLVVATATITPALGIQTPTGSLTDAYGNGVAAPTFRIFDTSSSDIMTMSLTAKSGTIAMTGSGGAALAGSGTASISATGTQAQLQTDLNTLRFTGTVVGTGSLAMAIKDAAGSVAQAQRSITVSADTISLTLAEHAYSGNAQFIVKVDGKEVSGPTAVTASQATGASQVFRFSGDWGLTPQTIELDFTNGLVGNTAATTRSLYIDQITYNGVAEMTETVTMTSTSAYVVTAHPTT
jgi:parallel beta-helix repeat protein